MVKRGPRGYFALWTRIDRFFDLKRVYGGQLLLARREALARLCPLLKGCQVVSDRPADFDEGRSVAPHSRFRQPG